MKQIVSRLIFLFIFLAGCGGYISEDGGGTSGAVTLTIDQNKNVTKVDIDCASGGKSYKGSYDTQYDVSFDTMGDCAGVTGDADLAYCDGTADGTCAGTSVSCTISLSNNECACTVRGDSDSEKERAANQLIQAWNSVRSFGNNAISDANQGKCQVSGSKTTYTCTCR